jgi:hypothetical protein
MPSEADVRRVVAALETMPDWTSFSLGEAHAEERLVIEAQVKAIAALDLAAIRAGLEAYRRAHVAIETAYTAVEGKSLILIRYLFALPESLDHGSPHFPYFGCGVGWHGLPFSDEPGHPSRWEPLSMRWPWSVDDDGQWHLTGVYTGYFGAPTSVMQEFDYAASHFGRRVDIWR